MSYSVKVSDYFPKQNSKQDCSSRIPLVIGTVLQIQGQLWTIGRITYKTVKLVNVHGHDLHFGSVEPFEVATSKAEGLCEFSETDMKQMLDNCYREAVVVDCLNQNEEFAADYSDYDKVKVSDYFTPPAPAIPLTLGTIIKVYNNNLFVITKTGGLQLQLVQVNGRDGWFSTKLETSFEKVNGKEFLEEKDMKTLLDSCYEGAVVVGSFNKKYWRPVCD